MNEVKGYCVNKPRELCPPTCPLYQAMQIIPGVPDTLLRPNPNLPPNVTHILDPQIQKDLAEVTVILRRDAVLKQGENPDTCELLQNTP